jgi:2-oxoglutarate dehydrogenase complex dehydrogenase (E1) component-like enzyme
MDKLFASESIHLSGPLTLRELIGRLERTYCGPDRIEFMHIGDRLQAPMVAAAHRAIEDAISFRC